MLQDEIDDFLVGFLKVMEESLKGVVKCLVEDVQGRMVEGRWGVLSRGGGDRNLMSQHDEG